MKDINEKVDNLFPQKRSRRKQMGKMGKIALVCFISGILVLTVSATYISFFNEVNTTINVVQGVQMDNQDYDQPISHTIDDAMGGCCYCFEHTVENDGCKPVDLSFTEVGSPDLDGIDIKYLLRESSCCDHYLTLLEVDVLDGSALDDDFEVYVDSNLAYTYDAISTGAENWITHSIDLTPLNLVCCGHHTIEVKCIAASAWSGHATYGQLAVNVISLYCEPDVPGDAPILCDTVDIGNLASEAGHSVSENPDWGPIEPMTSGGGYGGIVDCRCAWEPTCPGNECRSATCVLTCADCYEPGGCPDCDTGIPVTFPIHLEQGESLDFCICYDLAPLIQKGAYTVDHYLVPAIL